MHGRHNPRALMTYLQWRDVHDSENQHGSPERAYCCGRAIKRRPPWNLPQCELRLPSTSILVLLSPRLSRRLTARDRQLNHGRRKQMKAGRHKINTRVNYPDSMTASPMFTLLGSYTLFPGGSVRPLPSVMSQSPRGGNRCSGGLTSQQTVAAAAAVALPHRQVTTDAQRHGGGGAAVNT